MRLLSLDVEGLASLRDRQRIDFSAFDGLFAIVGPTGAGKTTILDAVSLALFGRLPRMDRSLRDFMSLGLSRTRVCLEFAVAGKRYVVTRTFSRKGSHEAALEEVMADGTREALDHEAHLSVVATRMERLLGMDYETFSRVILLPQGAFAQMLQGSAKDRREILTRLLDLSRYEKAGAIARERAKEMTGTLSMRSALLSSEYSDATPESLTALMAEVFDLDERIRSAEKILASLTDLSSEQATAASRLSAIERSSGLLEGLRSSVEILLSRLKASEPAMARLEAEALEASECLDASAQSLDAAEVEARDLSSRTGSRADAYKALQDASALSSLTSDLAHARDSLATTTNAMSDLGYVRDKAAAEQDRQREIVSRARAAHEKAVAQGAALSAALAMVQSSVAAEVALREAVAAMEKSKASRARSAEAHEGALSAVALSQDKLDHALQRGHVAALVGGLSTGDPCPVCSSVLSAVPVVPGESLEPMKKELALVRTRLSALEKSLSEADKVLAVSLERVSSAEAALAAVPAPDASLVARESVIHRDIAESAASLDVAMAQLSALDIEHSRAATALAETGALLGERTAKVESTLGRIGQIRGRLEGMFGPADDFSSLASSRIAMLDQVLEKVEVARKDKDAAASRLSRARTELARGQKALLGLGQERSSLVAKLDSLLPDFLAPVGLEASDDGGFAALARGAEATRSLLDRERESVRGVVADLSGRITALVAPLALPPGRDIYGVTNMVTGLRTSLARSETSLERLTGRVERRKVLEKEVADLSLSSERLHKIGLELKGDRFIKYVLDESFRDLALRASVELEGLSDGRYSLEASGDSFVVVDHMNADETRSVTTLSGGESFLASLALALGLARGLGDLSGGAAISRLESIFIDEGFGTLDPATLDIVMDGLERISTDGRTIGVITHVREMAERIPEGLEVSPGNNGSRVTPRAG